MAYSKIKIGFSTGSIVKGDFKKGIAILNSSESNAIELSALREEELFSFVKEIDNLDLNKFEYVSFHAPSKLTRCSEYELAEALKPMLRKKWMVVIHPDIINDFNIWQEFGEYLCVENMDKRKPIGQTADQLLSVFHNLPLASFCFDIAHAKQIDPSMTEGLRMLKLLGNRLKQIHVSDVNSSSIHEPLNLDALLAYKMISDFIPRNIPIIIESPVLEKLVDFEIKMAKLLFDDSAFEKLISYIGSTTNSFYKMNKSRLKVLEDH